MNILFFSRLFYPHIGGVEKHVLEISKILVALGHDVTVLTEKITGTQDEEVIEGINIKRISAGKNDWLKKFRIWKQLWKHMDLIKNADIVHCHDVFFWYLPFRFIFFKKPVYTTFHGYEGNKIPGFKSKLMHKLAEKFSKGNICVGDFLKKWYGTNPDYVIYGGVNVKKIKNQKLKIKKINQKLKILFLGRLEEETGIMVYLEALELLKDKNYEFELTVLGEGTLLKKAKEFVQKNRLKTVFKGFIEDIDGYLNQSDFVFVSRYLGILEALSFKKFVFAVYNNSIKKDYLKMTPFAKYISISNDKKELAKEIEYYTKNPKEEETLINGGFKWVRSQTWEKVVSNYLSLWNK